MSEGTMAHLSSVHAKGIDPVELAEILKEGIENRRIIVFPDHDIDQWVDRIRGLNQPIEDYPLTEEERKNKIEERMASGGGRPHNPDADRTGTYPTAPKASAAHAKTLITSTRQEILSGD
ncbi:MAG: hypothetical protein FWC96_03755 [Oscillospiraceae bacterium]|nr:hypothetical protein [Oscillospiraceae bacterium]